MFEAPFEVESVLLENCKSATACRATHTTPTLKPAERSGASWQTPTPRASQEGAKERFARIAEAYEALKALILLHRLSGGGFDHYEGTFGFGLGWLREFNTDIITNIISFTIPN